MKIDLSFRLVWVSLVILMVQSPDDVWTETEGASAHRTATAIRIEGNPPKLDGVLDDEIWKTAPLHEGFRQRDPDEGEPLSERMTFQIVYDYPIRYFLWDHPQRHNQPRFWTSRSGSGTAKPLGV